MNREILEGGRPRKLAGKPWLVFRMVALAAGLWSLYYALRPIETYHFRMFHLLFILVLGPLLFPASKRFADRVHLLDAGLIVLAVIGMLYPLTQFERFVYGAAEPNSVDILIGGIVIALILESTRRTAGPIVAGLLGFFLAYAYLGNYFPAPFSHRGYDIDRIVGHMYMTLEGIFGIGIDVSASFVILFVIYGAFMDASGTSRFFLEMTKILTGRGPASAGRATVLATGLLGGPQASGVATTLSVGPLVKPYLSQAGYSPEKAAGLLSAGGIGAVISPPVMGAAAFLIMEFLKVSFFDVLLMVTIPTILFYVDLWAIVEFEAKALGLKGIRTPRPPARVLLRNLYHVASIAILISLIALGLTPSYAAFFAIMTVVLTSFLSRKREEWLTPRRMAEALVAGVRDFIPVGIILAGIGIIVGSFTLTGLGLKLAGIIVSASMGSREMALLLSGLATIVVGLAVPITASYVITVIMVAPALALLGVPLYVAHIFVFYYSVLSEVSPPVGLSPTAAASILGARPFTAMMEAFRYSVPVFLVPFFFSTVDQGAALLLIDPRSHQFVAPGALVTPLALSVIAVILLAIARAGYFLVHMNPLERLVVALSGTIMGIYSNSPERIGIGASLFGAIALWQILKRRRANTQRPKVKVSASPVRGR